MGAVLSETAAGGPRLHAASPYRCLVGVGGVGSGLSFALEGNQTLGRSESRPGRLLDVRDYCKLHIVCHYVARLLGAGRAGAPFHVLPVAKVGADAEGRRLRAELARAGADVSEILEDKDRPTLFSVCFHYPDRDGGNITTTNSAAGGLTAAEIDRSECVLERHGARAIVLAAPEAPLDARRHLLKLGGKHGCLRAASFTSSEIADVKREGLLSHVDILALNEEEAAALAGCPLNIDAPEPFLGRCADALSPGGRSPRALITAGRHGAFALTGGNWDFCPAPAVQTASTAGAGDALLAGVLAALALELPFMNGVGPSGRREPVTALDFGVWLAALSVTSPHTIHPDADLDSLFAFAERHGLWTRGAAGGGAPALDKMGSVP